MQEIVTELLNSKKQLDTLITDILKNLTVLGLSTNDLQSSISKISNTFKDLAYFELSARSKDNETLYEVVKDDLTLLIHIQTGIKYYCKSNTLFSCESLLYLPPEFRVLGEQFVKQLKHENKKIQINFTGDFIDYPPNQTAKFNSVSSEQDELAEVAKLRALEKSSPNSSNYPINPKFSHLANG